MITLRPNMSLVADFKDEIKVVFGDMPLSEDKTIGVKLTLKSDMELMCILEYLIKKGVLKVESYEDMQEHLDNLLNTISDFHYLKQSVEEDFAYQQKLKQTVEEPVSKKQSLFSKLFQGWY